MQIARMRVRLLEYEHEEKTGMAHSAADKEHMQWVRDALQEWDEALREQERRVP